VNQSMTIDVISLQVYVMSWSVYPSRLP